jgi:FecR protein
MKQLLSSSLLLGALLLSGASASRAAAPDDGRAIIVATSGKVNVRAPLGSKHAGRSEQSSAAVGNAYSVGNTLTTGKDSRTVAVLSPGALLGVAPQTQVRFDELSERSEGLPSADSPALRRIRLTLDRGAIRMYAGATETNKSFQVDIPGASVTFSGGTHELSLRDGKWVLPVIEGQVVVKAKDQTWTIPAGSTGEIDLSNPEKPALVLRDTVPADRLPAEDAAFFDAAHAKFEKAVFAGKKVNLDQVKKLLEGEGSVITLIGNADILEDVSPSARGF